MAIKEICETRVCYGYRRVHVMLQRDGWQHNVKKHIALQRDGTVAEKQNTQPAC
jgi:putative transposase